MENTKELETRTGFLSGLIEAGLTASYWGSEGTRPVYTGEPPLGHAVGDGGFLIDENGSQSLVILELEASSPGNERNILKWAAPFIKTSTVQIRPGTAGESKEFSDIDVVLCFGRGPQGSKKSDWGDSDFRKTVAFGEMLAETMNDRLRNTPIRFTILNSVDRVIGWTEFGRAVAMQFAEQRSHTS